MVDLSLILDALLGRSSLDVFVNVHEHVVKKVHDVLRVGYCDWGKREELGKYVHVFSDKVQDNLFDFQRLWFNHLFFFNLRLSVIFLLIVWTFIPFVFFEDVKQKLKQYFNSIDGLIEEL